MRTASFATLFYDCGTELREVAKEGFFCPVGDGLMFELEQHSINRRKYPIATKAVLYITRNQVFDFGMNVGSNDTAERLEELYSDGAIVTFFALGVIGRELIIRESCDDSASIIFTADLGDSYVSNEGPKIESRLYQNKPFSVCVDDDVLTAPKFATATAEYIVFLAKTL